MMVRCRQSSQKSGAATNAVHLARSLPSIILELARRSSAMLLACSGSSEAHPAWGEEGTKKPPGLRLAIVALLLRQERRSAKVRFAAWHALAAAADWRLPGASFRAAAATPHLSLFR